MCVEQAPTRQSEAIPLPLPLPLRSGVDEDDEYDAAGVRPELKREWLAGDNVDVPLLAAGTARAAAAAALSLCGWIACVVKVADDAGAKCRWSSSRVAALVEEAEEEER